MCISFKKGMASEKRTLEWCLENYPNHIRSVKRMIGAIKTKIDINPNSKILEIGAAQGMTIFALKGLGYKDVSGIEPFREATEVLKKLSSKLNMIVDIKCESAENTNLRPNEYDLIIATSVMEHVSNDRKVFDKVFKSLKPGGAFYFTSASTLCLYQGEIRLFPFFSWYPDKLKKSIILWASKKHPALVNYTKTPAINWYSPRKVRKIANNLGFKQILNRWDLITPEYGAKKNIIVKIGKSCRLMGLLIDCVIPTCRFLLIK
ncbi:MAG: methyltransferase domain-containing protein [bacterium]